MTEITVAPALELDKVLHMLAQKASTADAAEAAKVLTPSPYLQEVTHRLDETDDAARLMAGYGSPSFGHIKNMKNAWHRAAAGAMLSLRELLDIAAVLRTVRALCEWRERSQGVETTLDDRFAVLSPNKFLEERISLTVLSEDEVADTASTELATIRRKMRQATQRVREQLDNMVKSPTYQKLLQDPIVTIRSGRFVIPVKAEHRAQVPGLVHDTSASGATVFVEPMGAVEANNELKVLLAKEEAEIERILFALSAQVGEFADALSVQYDVIIELDLIFAKAALAYDMKAMRPAVSDDGVIVLRAARHPLIDKDKVVPVDVTLGETFDTLVITGPNTGGKTVTLKTLGLLTLMMGCGLLVPCGDGSRLSVFDRVLVDIGDEQSIEQSLSTFSAHMTNVARILKQADEKSLVLLDELGSGTDPVEGAALATAILEELRRNGARIAATTHYAELKAYAIHTDGVENGSCEFDVASLRPTYRLIVGAPGRSNAFAISARLGIDGALIDRAKVLVSGDDRRLEEVVVRLEERRRSLEEELKTAKELRRRSDEEGRMTREQLAKMRMEQDKLLEDARREADRITEKARLEAERLLDELEALRKQSRQGASAAQAAKTDLRQKLKSLDEARDPVKKAPGNSGYRLPRELKVGDEVLIFDIDKKATVLSLPDKSGQVEVQAGIIRTRVAVSNLRLIETKKTPQKPGSVARSMTSRMERTAETDLDLRGMASDEGLLEVDRFIDNAVMAGVPAVTIIHGKGTGVLRAAVQQHLRRHPSVKSFRLGTYGEGESGVTIVELK
ncbi:MAG: endonuclease MutS2 [Clostridia bacterium]|nr:endonuclease MutS2 [Clostridia bacterium]